MTKDPLQQRLSITIGPGGETRRRKIDKAETFGERIDRNIQRRLAVPSDPGARSEAQYSAGDDLAAWHLRHKHEENY